MIPIEIRRVKDPDGKIRVSAMTPLSNAFLKKELYKELKLLESRYCSLVKVCKKHVKKIKSSTHPYGAAVLRWKLGDAIQSFINKCMKKGFAVTNVVSSISQDLGFSQTEVRYWIRFRKICPRRTMIKRSISWSSYRRLLRLKDRRAIKEALS